MRSTTADRRRFLEALAIAPFLAPLSAGASLAQGSSQKPRAVLDLPETIEVEDLVAAYGGRTTFPSANQMRYVEYHVDWGDGTSTSPDAYSTHVYVAPGVYTVRLDADSLTGPRVSTSKTIVVTPRLAERPNLDAMINAFADAVAATGIEPPSTPPGPVASLFNVAHYETWNGRGSEEGIETPGSPEALVSSSHYQSAAHAIIGVQDALVRAQLAGQISDTVLGALLRDHSVPLLDAFVKEALFVESGGACCSERLSPLLFPFNSSWWCRAKVWIKYQAINAAIRAVASLGTVGCGTLLSIPLIGAPLTVVCGQGVSIAANRVYAEATSWYNAALRTC